MTRALVLAGWAVLSASLVACEGVAIVTRRVARLATALHRFNASGWRRVAGLAGWAWLGWHLFAR